MDAPQFWRVIDQARDLAADPFDTDTIARHAQDLLAALPAEEITAAEQAFWDLMARSYRNPLWAAAYIANGGCSDDGFDYFRGWLILQGRTAYDQAIHDPDSLADLPAVAHAAATGIDLDGEIALSMTSRAFTTATGQESPHSYTITYPDPDPSWNFDFDDEAEMHRRLPRLSALYQY